MLIVGAGGLASQLFDDIITLKKDDFVFWSEENSKYRCINEHYKILKTDYEVVDYFTLKSTSFVVGIWDVEARKRLTEKFKKLGGQLVSFITPFSYLSSYTAVGNGSVIMHKASAEPGVIIGESCIVNKRANFGHGCFIAPYCNIGPYAIIGSDAEIGEGSCIGMGAIVQPKIKIGKNVIIAAGAVVTKNIPDNRVVSGVPGKIRFIRKK
jgi:sugar O-acyltransferase (sialic acid O-acetyltransferase NeuD family)